MNLSTTERQIDLEQESVRLGAIRYRKDQPLEWRETAAGKKEETEMAPGKQLLMKNLVPVSLSRP